MANSTSATTKRKVRRPSDVRTALRIAILEHYRCYHDHDRFILEMLYKHGGEKPVLSLKAFYFISIIYGLKPPVVKGEGGRVIQYTQAYIDGLNELASRWPSTLKGRSRQCKLFVCRAVSKKHTSNNQASAATKFLWFLRPHGWTMFDSLAKNALRISPGRADEEMRAFFLKLIDLKFVGAAACLSEILRLNGFGELYGERVIDKFLMLHSRINDSTVSGMIKSSRQQDRRFDLESKAQIDQVLDAVLVSKPIMKFLNDVRSLR